MMMLDTNVLIDLREEDGEWFRWSAVTISRADAEIAVSVVAAGELAVGGDSLSEINALLRAFLFAVVPLPLAAAVRAGEAHRVYRRRGGGRDKLLADFLIGAHAISSGATLITRDPRHYRTYFPDLPLITPETHP